MHTTLVALAVPRQKRNPEILGVLASLLAVVFVAAAIWIVLSNGRTANQPEQGTPAGSVTAPQPTTNPTQQDTATPGNATPDLTATLSTEEVATIVALKQAEATGHAVELTTSPVPTQEPVATGIRDDEQQRAMWATMGLIIENGFAARVDGNTVGVWAGALASDQEQGVVQVMWFFPKHTVEQRLLTPSKHGSVHITDEENNRLTLVSIDGTTPYFDIPGLTFASSPTEVVPTITPVPSYTPPVPPTTVAPPTAYPLPSTSTPPAP